MLNFNNIKNVVVVRFSLRVPAWRKKIFFNDKNRDAWFKFRSELYKQTLGLSIKSQTKQADRVYLLMDENDGDLYAKYLEDSYISPIFSKDSNHNWQVGEDLVRSGLCENIAMSRIDSDDIIARDYFEKINTQISELVNQGQTVEYLVACTGYRSDFSQAQPIHYIGGPFITLYKQKYSYETVYGFEHKSLLQKTYIQNYDAEWMQVIHGTNVVNGFAKPTGHTLSKEEIKDHPDTIVGDRETIDNLWFENWAGFTPPDSTILNAAPTVSMWGSVRKFFRRLKGKL